MSAAYAHYCVGPARLLHAEVSTMMDLVFIALIAGVYAVSYGLVVALARLGKIQ